MSKYATAIKELQQLNIRVQELTELFTTLEATDTNDNPDKVNEPEKLLFKVVEAKNLYEARMQLSNLNTVYSDKLAEIYRHADKLTEIEVASKIERLEDEYQKLIPKVSNEVIKYLQNGESFEYRLHPFFIDRARVQPPFMEQYQNQQATWPHPSHYQYPSMLMGHHFIKRR